MVVLHHKAVFGLVVNPNLPQVAIGSEMSACVGQVRLEKLPAQQDAVMGGVEPASGIAQLAERHAIEAPQAGWVLRIVLVDTELVVQWRQTAVVTGPPQRSAVGSWR